MSSLTASPPTQAGFVEFIRGVMGINSIVLPDNSTIIPDAYDIALATVNVAIACAPPFFTLATYNLGGDILVNYAVDVTPPVIYQDGLTYFAYLRKTFGINSLVAGLVESSSDNGTSNSLVVPDWAKNLTLADLQNMKTPWGRAYIGIAQKYGTLWGLS